MGPNSAEQSASLPIGKSTCEKIFEPDSLGNFPELFVGATAKKAFLG
jgi:hypothetical protein